MRTAVLISGQMRTFKKCYPNMKWMVFRHYPEIHFFVSVFEDEDSKLANLLQADYDNVNIETHHEPGNLIESSAYYSDHAPYAPSVTPRQIMMQLYANKKVLDFIGDRLFNYKTVIRLRADLWFHRFVPPSYPPGDNTCYCPWWGQFGGVNDRFAVMGPRAASYYFRVYEYVNHLIGIGCPLHTESLLAATLAHGRVNVFNNLATEFSRTRSNGDFKLPEISLVDIANYARH